MGDLISTRKVLFLDTKDCAPRIEIVQNSNVIGEMGIVLNHRGFWVLKANIFSLPSTYLQVMPNHDLKEALPFNEEICKELVDALAIKLMYNVAMAVDNKDGLKEEIILRVKRNYVFPREWDKFIEATVKFLYDRKEEDLR